MELSQTASGLNPANYYPFVAVLAVLGIVITAAYVIRAIGRVFLGEYDEHHWHDMRPLLGIDKLALLIFVVIMIVIGLFPSVISPIVESGVTPVVARLEEAQQAQAGSVVDALHVAAFDLVQRLGGT